MLLGEDAADVPRSFKIISLPRNPRLQTGRWGSGIAVLIHILVLDLGTMLLIGAYIPPVSPIWPGWTNVELMYTATMGNGCALKSAEKHLAVLTDINGPTASEQVPGMALEWLRVYEDDTLNTCGQEILRECDTNGPCMLNGTSLEAASPGCLLPLVKEFHVETPAANPENDWADHVRICLTLDVSAIQKNNPEPTIQGSARLDLSDATEMDRLYQATLESRENPGQALQTL
ncbi:hypothetical protein DFH08DRAFT_825574 [Mycena albidolilacea]|uniref:Uncharacterized protein n=1 Tax=Mycena albidolilacea TaxID=1033008 RepID=A0AAD7EA15_9AGAR|nr:hypothetical protein DFH08DRAFT_825574 [Mycena albidolilacea]